MTATLPTSVPVTEHGVTCGRCSAWQRPVKHASATAVRLCYMGATVVERDSNGDHPVVRMTSLRPVPGARPAAPVAPVDTMRADMLAAEGRTAEAARLYEASVTAPAETVPTSATVWNTHDDVDPGRYAVRGTDGVVKFYKIDKGRAGTRWAGMTFVSVMASDEEHPVRNRAARLGILAAILVDVDSARRLYGQEIGRCARCNRTLTDETSRAYGMGPECRTK